MDGLGSLGKMLMVLGGVMLVFGALLAFGEKLPGIGRLPGDILIRRGNFTFYFPLATSVALSVILTLLLALFSRR
ncbi:MAG: DUF2905 domain-containing protein [Firmicutes bacterium]|nr:DUF2905 domain-containing protein [Bacillota bacterium]MDH7496102.1 DUF2905 domain-containing protein [Bacillota bacterium]